MNLGSSTATRTLKKKLAQKKKSGPRTGGPGTTGVQTISALSEAVVTAFLKFIYTDMVYFELIDEDHDLFQREMAHGRCCSGQNKFEMSPTFEKIC